MTLIDQLISEHIAENPFHAANMLTVLQCGELPTDAERLERCKLYKAWKQAGETKKAARRRAIAGEPVPPQMFEEAE